MSNQGNVAIDMSLNIYAHLQDVCVCVCVGVGLGVGAGKITWAYLLERSGKSASIAQSWHLNRKNGWIILYLVNKRTSQHS